MIGTAIRNLLIIFSGAGSASPGAADITIAGSTPNDRSMLFQRDDGTLMLVIWNEKDAPHAVTVNLGASAMIDLYDPLTSSDPTVLASNAMSASVPISDRPVIVQIGGISIINPPPVQPPPVNPPPVQPPPVQPPPVIITPRFTPAPMWGVPDKYFVGTDVIHLAGLAISDQYADGHAGKMALNMSVDAGALAMLGPDGNPVLGSGTAAIHLQAGLADINVALTTATYDPAKVRPVQAILTLDIWDQAGIHNKITRPIIY